MFIVKTKESINFKKQTLALYADLTIFLGDNDFPGTKLKKLRAIFFHIIQVFAFLLEILRQTVYHLNYVCVGSGRCILNTDRSLKISKQLFFVFVCVVSDGF